MPFTMKSTQDVYNDMQAFVQARSDITDFNVGSVVRTILEAAALNDAELYLQLAFLKALNNLNLVSGDDLDERALEYSITRLAATASTVQVKFGDSGVTAKVSSTLASALTAGTAYTQITLASASAFPSAGFIVIDRDTDNREVRVRYSSKSGNVLTLATAFTPTKSHTTSSTVILSQQGVDRTVPKGTTITAPATSTRAEVKFVTGAEVVLKDGDVYTDEVTATSSDTGVSQNVGAGEVSALPAKPWTTITVLNVLPSSPARDTETDEALRSRIRYAIQTASRGTALAVERAAVGVTSGDFSVQLAQLVETVDGTTPSTLYVHDGSSGSNKSFDTSTALTGHEVLVYHAAANQRRARLKNWPVLPSSAHLYTSVAGASANQNGFGDATATGPLTLTDSTKSWTTNVWQNAYLIDNNFTKYQIASNTATTLTLVAGSGTPAVGAYGIFKSSVSASALVEGTDYKINLSTGEVELVVGKALQAKQWLIAWDEGAGQAYTYRTGLLAEVQKVINGDPADKLNYPGYKAFGVLLYVDSPTIDTQAITVSVTSETGVSETAALRTAVAEAISGYISSLKIGEALVVSEIISRCQQVSGVYDTQMVSPTSNVQVLPGHLFRATSITVQ